jgi:hypothetical protein
MHDNPEIPVNLVHDGADNWFVRGTARARVRLVMELAIPRDTFGRELADVDWSVLDALEGSRSMTAAVPSNPRAFGYRGAGAGAGARLHEAAFNEVAQAVGISRALRPREVVRKMVDYFRSFSPSEEPPSGRGDIYLDLALSKKGVCRHRAFAFLVTALGIGIPARMVVNEAHAWVEVSDSRLWHRIDLGGAAANLDTDPDPSKPPYVPPPDPYAWPATRDSGQDLAERNRAQQQRSQAGGSDHAGDGGTEGSSTSSVSPSASSEPRAPEAEVSVAAIDGDVHRGLPFHLQGQVQSAGTPCPHLRVDVVLVGHAEPSGRVERGPSTGTPGGTPGITVGSLSTDAQGRYDGAVIVPHDLALGDYDVVVQTPGDTRCGAGRTK